MSPKMFISMSHLTLLIAIGFSATLSPVSAYAFYTVQETGELLTPSQKQFATELQVITSGKDDGLNILGRFDKGFDDESNLRFVAGSGATDFVIGGFFKWVPFPDFEKQPAIGFTFGAHVAHYSSESELAVRVIPFIGKKFDTSHGEFSPYVSIPFAFRNYNDKNSVPLQLVLGSRYKHPEFAVCDFNAELGFDLNDAFTYLSLGAIFPAFE